MALYMIDYSNGHSYELSEKICRESVNKTLQIIITSRTQDGGYDEVEMAYASCASECVHEHNSLWLRI
jgi:hypothetical protein